MASRKEMEWCCPSGNTIRVASTLRTTNTSRSSPSLFHPSTRMEVFDVERDHLEVVYTAGISAFPEEACISYARSGTVAVEAEGPRSVHVRIEVLTVDDPRGKG